MRATKVDKLCDVPLARFLTAVEMVPIFPLLEPTELIPFHIKSAFVDTKMMLDIARIYFILSPSLIENLFSHD